MKTNYIFFLLLFIIVFLIVYLSCRFFTKYYSNNNIKIQQPKQETSVETYQNSQTTPLTDIKITNYSVKSSYNSCLKFSYLSGYSLNINSISDVLKRGYRMIDLEIFPMEEGNNKMGLFVTANYRYDDNSNQTNIRPIPLSHVIYNIIYYGLNKSTDSALNYYEPLFINLRICGSGKPPHPIESKPNYTYQDYYNEIYDFINTYHDPPPGSPSDAKLKLSTFLNPKKGDDLKNSTLSGLSAKETNQHCILMIDHTFLSATEYKNSKLPEIENISSGFHSDQVRMISYKDIVSDLAIMSDSYDLSGSTITQTPPVISDDGTTLVNTDMKMSIHTDSTSTLHTSYFKNRNPPPERLITTYGIQFPTVLACNKDINLSTYEDIFNNSTVGTGGGGGTTETDNKGYVLISRFIQHKLNEEEYT